MIWRHVSSEDYACILDHKVPAPSCLLVQRTRSNLFKYASEVQSSDHTCPGPTWHELKGVGVGQIWRSGVKQNFP